jgi:translation initiation factor 1A
LHEILGRKTNVFKLCNHLWKKNVEAVYIVGKRKAKREDYNALKVPAGNDIIGIAKTMLGFDRLRVTCQDGKERLCRIRGKMKRRMWIRVGDIVLVSPWDFQSDTRGDIIWRYKRNQADWLRRKGYLKI